jgi:hypothetical protein
MKKIFLFYLMFIAANSLPAQKQDLLSGKYTYEGLNKILIPQSKWRPFPKPEDREAWSRADPTMMKAILAKADSFIGYEWPYIPATKSLLIERTGDRQEYEDMSFKKREVLGTMLIAEIFENKGRFIDPIINGVWSICEESFWGVPAHLPKTKAYSGLMDTSQPFVELFSAETATVLSWVDYFLGDQLDAVSPQIRKRIYREINFRIFEPLMTNPHGWMQANADGRRPNNWNPWICSNWLNSVLLLEKNDSLRTATVLRITSVLDNFLNPYPPDGGCDEGPGYWGAAAASLYDNISMLNLATTNAFDDVFRDEKIRNMGKFIYRAQIGEKYFLDFADADPQPGMAASMIYRFGKDIHDDDMMKFGAYYRKTPTGSISTNHFFRNFFELLCRMNFSEPPRVFLYPRMSGSRTSRS